MKTIHWGLPLLAAALLAGCGGGGGDTGAAPFQTGGGGTTTPGGTGGTGGTGTTPPTTPTTPAGGISTVSTGVPNQRFMSISVEKYALDWSKDGDETAVTVRVADSAGNPVPEGTRVQFSTSGGQVQTSCALSGVASGASQISACSVTFATQNFRPGNGIVGIVAWLQGEEAYKDVNANGRYDAGEPFADAGRLFRDDDGSGDYTAAVDELDVGGTLAGAPGIGASACVIAPEVPLNEPPGSVPGTCDGVWGATLVRASVYLPVSDPRFIQVAVAGSTVRVWSDFGSTDVAAPSGTTLTATNVPADCTVAVSPAAVPGNAVLPTLHTITSTGAGCAGARVGIEVKFGDYSRLVTATLP